MTDLSDRAKAVLTDIEAEMSREGGGDVLQSAFEIIEELLTSPSKRVERLETALADIAAERERQKSVEGWTEAHDDEHIRGEMALAAACYAVAEFPSEAAEIATRELWPWDTAWWKPKGFRRNLVRAAALLVAEIERLDRVTARRMTSEELRRQRPSGTRRPKGQALGDRS